MASWHRFWGSLTHLPHSAIAGTNTRRWVMLRWLGFCRSGRMDKMSWHRSCKSGTLTMREKLHRKKDWPGVNLYSRSLRSSKIRYSSSRELSRSDLRAWPQYCWTTIQSSEIAAVQMLSERNLARHIWKISQSVDLMSYRGCNRDQCSVMITWRVRQARSSANLTNKRSLVRRSCPPYASWTRKTLSQSSIGSSVGGGFARDRPTQYALTQIALIRTREWRQDEWWARCRSWKARRAWLRAREIWWSLRMRLRRLWELMEAPGLLIAIPTSLHKRRRKTNSC